MSAPQQYPLPPPGGWPAPPPAAAWTGEWVATVPQLGGWPPPVPAAAAPAPAADRGKRVPPTVLLALAGTMVAAAAVAALVVALVFSAQAGSIGERVGAAAGEELARAQADQMEQMMGGYPGWDTGGPLPPVEKSEPVPPGELGPDPVLDRYAQDCFTGDLQACDDLFFQSAPYSEYERYGSTCGGRVKPLQVPFCTDLD